MSEAGESNKTLRTVNSPPDSLCERRVRRVCHCEMRTILTLDGADRGGSGMDGFLETMAVDVEAGRYFDESMQRSSQSVSESSDDMQDVDIGISCKVAIRRRRLGRKGS